MGIEIIIDSNEEESSQIDIEFINKFITILLDYIKENNISKEEDLTLYLSKDLNIIFVDSKTIRELNREYRNIDRTTDVLSFYYNDEDLNLWGELYINPYQVEKQRKRYNVSFKEELSRIIIHGILHLLGYDHQTPKERDEMFALQEKILNDLKRKGVI